MGESVSAARIRNSVAAVCKGIAKKTGIIGWEELGWEFKRYRGDVTKFALTLTCAILAIESEGGFRKVADYDQVLKELREHLISAGVMLTGRPDSQERVTEEENK